MGFESQNRSLLDCSTYLCQYSICLNINLLNTLYFNTEIAHVYICMYAYIAKKLAFLGRNSAGDI